MGGRVREELLSVELFSCLAEAPVLIEGRRHGYNENRSHSALGMVARGVRRGPPGLTGSRARSYPTSPPRQEVGHPLPIAYVLEFGSLTVVGGAVAVGKESGVRHVRNLRDPLSRARGPMQ